MNHKKLFIFKLLLSFSLIFSLFLPCIIPVAASGIPTTEFSKDPGIPYILLPDYYHQMSVGDHFILITITSNQKLPKFKSSCSSIASVTSSGIITAKKPGSVLITARIPGAESSCLITVNPTVITMKKNTVAMENGSSYQIETCVSTQTKPVFRSCKPSIASVSKDGLVTAKKPGSVCIKISADGTTVSFMFTVLKPTISLNVSELTLFRKQQSQIIASTSSGRIPSFKSSSSKIASVDALGMVTGIKHGTTRIKVKLDGVTKICLITVLPPEIILNHTRLSLTCGESFSLTATISSGNPPTWSSSNSEVV
ncbi:MAG: Ig-like domain-containing protein, partial [Lachnospiraceae bacterium]